MERAFSRVSDVLNRETMQRVYCIDLPINMIPVGVVLFVAPLAMIWDGCYARFSKRKVCRAQDINNFGS